MRFSIRTIVPALAALALALAAPSLASPETGETDRVGRAVDELFEIDAARAELSASRLARQDIVRQEIDICVDPPARRVTATTRVWIESAEAEVRLLLARSFDVTSIIDSRRTELAFARAGDTLRVLAPPGHSTFPLEIEISYGGDLVRGPDSWVSDALLALGPDSHWYPVSPWRDPARLKLDVRYPEGYTSVVSGALAGMAPSISDDGSCTGGDLWEVPTPVPGAGIVVGTVESSLTVVGGVFIGYHRVIPRGDAAAPPGRSGTSTEVPQELTTLLRYLENCYGPYPYEWLNVVLERVPDAGRTSLVVAPGLVVVRSATAGLPLDSVASGLSHSWWTHWMDAGPLFSQALATHARIGWLEATGDDDEAGRRRGFRQAQYMRAVADSARGIPLLRCLGTNPVLDERVCAGKGSAVLEMLEFVIGEKSVCEGLRAVVSEHEGGSVVLGELATAFEEAAGEELDWFFYEWMARSDLPSYALDYETAPRQDGTFLVRGSILQEGQFFRTPVPLTIDLGGWSYEEIVEVESSHQPFEFVTIEKPIDIALDTRHLIPRVRMRECAEMHYRRGMEAVERHEFIKAVDEFGAAASYFPSDSDFMSSYGSALVRAGRLADGLAAYEKAAELAPEEWDRRMLLSDLYLRSQDYASALGHLDACVESRANDTACRLRRAQALIGLGRLDEAGESLERVRVLFEEHGREPGQDEDFVLATGMLAEARGDTEAAVEAYEAVLFLNPVSDDARRRLRALKLP